MRLQHLTLTLDGITAGDYLQWVRDPEPRAVEAAPSRRRRSPAFR